MPYKTKSLFIASFLYSNPEIVLDGVDKNDVDNIFFIFSPEDKAIKLVDSYYIDHTNNINAKAHDEAQKNLKDLIFECKRQNNR